MPKKQPRNAFWYFMQAYKKKREAQGESFPGGLAEVSNACVDEWKSLTADQKATYVMRSKDAKLQNNSCEKYSSQGVPLSFIEKEAHRKQEFVETMLEYIKMKIQMTPSLPTEQFFFIHVNWFCRYHNEKTNTYHFIPAEFAVGKFSLKHGIEEVYHEIVNIKIPLGYAREARDRSQTSHCIAMNPDNGETNFAKMFENLRVFMKDDTSNDKLPPLYTMRGGMEVVPGLIEYLTSAVGKSPDIFRIYSLEELFNQLRDTAADFAEAAALTATGKTEKSKRFPGGAVSADIELQKDYFSYRPELACNYHAHIDSAIIHCSMSIVKRWGLTICDHCCEDLNLPLVPGRNCPANVDTRRGISLNSSISSPANTTNSDDLGIPSMTGVTEAHRLKVSCRTYDEDQKRRREGKPIEVVDHGALRENASAGGPAKQSPAPHVYASSISANKSQKPLRLPTTKSFAMMSAGVNQDVDMNDRNFPAMAGRGKPLNRTKENITTPFGRGC